MFKKIKNSITKYLNDIKKDKPSLMIIISLMLYIIFFSFLRILELSFVNDIPMYVINIIYSILILLFLLVQYIKISKKSNLITIFLVLFFTMYVNIYFKIFFELFLIILIYIILNKRNRYFLATIFISLTGFFLFLLLFIYLLFKPIFLVFEDIGDKVVNKYPSLNNNYNVYKYIYDEGALGGSVQVIVYKKYPLYLQKQVKVFDYDFSTGNDIKIKWINNQEIMIGDCNLLLESLQCQNK